MPNNLRGKCFIIALVSIFILLIAIILIVSLLPSASSDEIASHKDYVGVVFSPYVKNKEGPQFPSWDSYSQKEVGIMLKLISTKFRNISTYGMGTKSRDSTWENGDAVGFTGVQAALLNKESSSTILSASVAIWQHHSDPVIINALKTAFDVTEKANKIYKGTIWGITITSNYIESPLQTDKIEKVAELLSMGKNISITRNIPVKLGIRLSICDKLTNEFIRILQKIDYVICFINPSKAPGKFSIKSTINHLENVMTDTAKYVKAMKSGIDVIFETGWPSAGIHGANIPTSVELMKEFWTEMSKWASSSKTHIYFLSAIDEPWKTSLSNDDKSPVGPCGSEGHYGWWRRVDNSDIHSYAEKVSSDDNPKSCQGLNPSI